MKLRNTNGNNKKTSRTQKDTGSKKEGNKERKETR